MPRKGGKIIGLAKDEKGKPTKEVSPTDPTAVQWFDTNTYKPVTKEQATGTPRTFGQESQPVAPGSPIKPSRPTSTIGLGRRKTRRGKKSRRVTRKR